MSVGPLVTEISVTFVLVAFLLHRYGNWSRHHVFVTCSVFTAWYFSFIIISILPLDVSTTAYRQCLKNEALKRAMVAPSGNTSNDSMLYSSGNTTYEIVDTRPETNTSVIVGEACQIPWSHIPEGVLPVLWRVVYWTSQALTWIIMPTMQSYATAGNFNISGKLRTALVENAIYYGTYLIIFVVLLIYVALLPNINLDWSKLVVICITASNTWGLFLLVLLLGYSLVEIPRSCWQQSKRGYVLNYLYFRTAKLSVERCEAEERLEDVLEEIQNVSEKISVSHPLRPHVETILAKCPEDKKNLLNRSRHHPQSDDHSSSVGGSSVTERHLVRLHQQVIKALHAHRRTCCQWSNLVENVMHWEDVARNEMSHDRHFKRSVAPLRAPWFLHRALCTPTLEWYWHCRARAWVLRGAAVVLGSFSVAVVWSEMTFFNKSPVLSLFAVFMGKAKDDYNYAFIELLSIGTIAYLCFCAYFTVFRVRIFNFYYLAPHQQTSEHSLIFAGMMLCRLTPPLCLNFLGLIHLDSHVTKDTNIVETAYTSIMGHMDVIAIVSDGFNIYFPILICVLCLANYFHCGTRFLHMIGFEQFIGDDEMTSDLVDEGRELAKRERTRRQRQEEGEARKRNYQQSRIHNNGSPLSTGFSQLLRSPSEESATAGLLRDVEPMDYTEERSNSRLIEEIQRTNNNRMMTSSSVGMEYSDIPPPQEGALSSSSWGGRPPTQRTRNIMDKPPRGLFDDV